MAVDPAMESRPVDDDNPTAKQYVLDPGGAWEVGQEIVSRAPTSFDDGKNESTPVVLDLCVCGDSKKYVGKGTLMPADEPSECVWEIGGAFHWCCTLRVGAVAIGPNWWPFERAKVK